jgi:hypothetical protein
MAIVYAVKTGNWSDTTVWNTGALPTSADDVYPNTFAVTINQNITVKSLDNRATTGVTAGGSFQPSTGSNFTLVCDTVNSGATSVLFLFSTNNFTFTITTNSVNSLGTANAITVNQSTVNLVINGNINANASPGIGLQSIGTFTLNGNAIANGAASALNCSGLGTSTINGFCQNSTTGGLGYTNSSNNINTIATINKAISVANSGVAAVANTGSLASVTVKEIEQGVFGSVPISGYVRLSTASGAFYKGVTTGSSTRTLSDPADIAGQVPAQTDVRFGVSYQGGSKTGSAYIPSASSVGFGVPVDNTVGSAALTPASVWDAATSSLTTSGSIGERLKNASTVDTTGDQLAALL